MQVVQRRMSEHKTAEGLEVCVLGEAKTSQEGAIQLAARHEDIMFGCARKGLTAPMLLTRLMGTPLGQSLLTRTPSTTHA